MELFIGQFCTCLVKLFFLGLESYRNVTFNQVSVVVSVAEQFQSFRVVDLIDREGNLEVVHISPQPGFQVIGKNFRFTLPIFNAPESALNYNAAVN